MRRLNRNHGVFLIYFLASAGVVGSYSLRPNPAIDQVGETGLAQQTVSDIPTRCMVRTTFAQSAGHAPVIQGWGGGTRDEPSNGQLEPTLSRLNQSGHNGARMAIGG